MKFACRFKRSHGSRAMRVLIAATSILAGQAFAQPGRTDWSCWYDRESAIVCRLKAVPAAALSQDQPMAEDPSPRAVPDRGARERPLPGMVRVLREQPGALIGKLVTIPLHGQAMDMAFVRQLALAVMCGSRAECRVDFLPGATELAQLSVLDFVDATDSALEE